MNDAFSPVIEKIISDLNSGVAPWRKGWENSGTPQIPVRENGQPFSGMNALMLMLTSYDKGYHATNYWLTFQQAKTLDGCVRKGEKGTPVILVKSRVIEGDSRADDKSAGSDDTAKILRYMRHYTVFNASQIDGLPDRYYGTAKATTSTDTEIEALLSRVPAKIITGSDRAFYNHGCDYVVMPPYSQFKSKGEFLGTTLHELAHWSGGASRLNREEYRGSDEGYAMEELVAEITAVLVSMRIGLPPSDDVYYNHIAYLAHWAKLLEQSPGAIFRAASKAQEAATYLLSFIAPEVCQAEAA